MTVIENSIEVDVEVNGEKWIPTDMEVSRSRYDETDTTTMKAIPDPDLNPDAVPKEGEEIIVRLGPRTSFVEGAGRKETDKSGSLYRVFTGYVSNSFEMQKGIWEIDAVNFILDLKKVTFNFSTGDELTFVSDIVEEVVKIVNERKDDSIQVDLEANISVDNPISDTRSGYAHLANITSGGENRDIGLVRQFTEKKMSDVLNELAKASNCNWWVDAHNKLQFGTTETSIHKLDWVTSTSAGKQTPPYRSVRVVGDGISSTSGRDARGLISKEGVLSQGAINRTRQTYGGYLIQQENLSDEDLLALGRSLSDPTFTYKNKSIKTREEADNIRDTILDELQEQQAAGDVTIVGRPMIDVLDVIEMPDRFGFTSGGETIDPAQYLVATVTHRVNNSDGYITKIECAGLAGKYSGPVFEYQNGQMILNTQDPDFEVDE